MTTIHLVRSVKGGSGKTAFALHKVIDLVTGAEEEATAKGKKVLYIDADVHASETMEMLYKKISETPQVAFGTEGTEGPWVHLFKFKEIKFDENGKPKPPQHSLNTYIHPYRGFYSKLHEIILEADLCEAKVVSKTNNDLGNSNKPKENNSNKSSSLPHVVASSLNDENESKKDISILRITQKSIDFILCDPSKEGRSVFGSLFQSAGQSAVGIGAYLAKIKNLLSYIIKSDYDNVVVDMPPGSDSFSENLADMIINFVTKNADKCELKVYYVSTDDIYHMISAAKAAIEHLHVMRSSSPIKVCFVYNQGRESVPTRSYATRASIISAERGVIGLTTLFSNTLCSKKESVEFELKRLDYYVFSRDEEYSNSLRYGWPACVFEKDNFIKLLK